MSFPMGMKRHIEDVRSLWGLAWLVALMAGVTGLLPAGAAFAEPFNVYLTYRGDTSRSIVVNYHVPQRLRDAPDPVVYVDTESRNGNRDAYARRVTGEKAAMPGLPVYRTLNAVEVAELEPDTVYYFVAGDDEHGYTEERSFRTVPAGEEAIRFVTGGDMNVYPLTERLLDQAAAQDPLFCAIGGDIAYVNGRFADYEKWDRWFEMYDSRMRTSEDRMIPMLVGIGNHETNDLPSTTPEVKAPFYTAFFGRQQSEGRTYFTQRFGRNIVFIVLDTGHIAPHAGDQATWLAQTLVDHRDVLYRFALYHVPLYPSHRAYEGTGSVLGRIHWEPYFSAYGLTTAFENHDHTLKRSKLLLNGEENEEGVLYLGDGCFGVEPRPVDDELRPYLEVQESAGHIWVVDVTVDGVEYRAVGDEGQTLDEYSHAARRSEPALAGN